MSSTNTLVDMVRSLVEPVVAREGLELVDVQFPSERGRSVLRLFIDTVPPGTKTRGVTVDECSSISRVVGDLLDVEDVVPGQYTLEVSSPGLFRPLTKPEHYDRALGERVKIKTFAKLEGRKVFAGVLTHREGQTVGLLVDGQEFELDLEKVAKANLEPLL